MFPALLEPMQHRRLPAERVLHVVPHSSTPVYRRLKVAS
jgi:hypothetical protein